MLILRCLQIFHRSSPGLLKRGRNLNFLSFPRSLSHVGCRFIFIFIFSCAKISLSVYFLLGQHTSVSWSSSFTITSPSKIEALSGFAEGLSSL